MIKRQAPRYFRLVWLTIGLAVGLSTDKAMAQPLRVTTDRLAPFYEQWKPLGRILESEGWYVWCVAPIYGQDGKVHVFYSRWKASKGMGGWLRGSEIAHAVADKPEGPYRYVETVLAPRPGYWDATTCHNPHIHYLDGRYYLFYMGNSNGKTNTKRIGVATAPSVYGPWTRYNHPLLEPGVPGSWDDHCTTNPAFVRTADGRCLLYYKSWNDAAYKGDTGSIRGNRQYGLAVADNPLGPYVKVKENPLINYSVFGQNRQVEDAFIWVENHRFHLLMRDMGFFNHTVGLYSTSDDGLTWTLPGKAWKGLDEYVKEPQPPAYLKRYGRLERPQLLMKDGHPAYLFTATQGGRFGTASGFVLQLIPAHGNTD